MEMSDLDNIYDRINDDLEILNRVKKEKSIVQEFYEGKTLFITGVTGFMGKCLLEKLLRSCSDLKHVYVLLRPKKHASIEERLAKFFQHEIFHNLRRTDPKFDKKVTAIKGDLFLDNLGLSKEDADVLKKETNIIFHNAANVKFTERVNIVLKENVLGTNDILDLAEQCQNLEIFMYVSSAYSHCYRQIIKEKFYDLSENLSMIYDMIDSDINSKYGLNEETVKMLLGNHFNLYTLSKAMCEEVIRQRSKEVKFACGVYRPSIVVNSVKEPLVGWVGNMNGPVIGCAAVKLGLLHTILDNGKPMDMVPCDLAINALLVVTWNLANQRSIENGAEVYNYGSSLLNPITLMDIFNYAIVKLGPKESSSKAIWMPFAVTTNSLWLFIIMLNLFHFIPACILDLILLLSGNKAQALPIFWKVTKYFDKLAVFTRSDWKIHMSKTLNVIESLNSVDKELFNCDIRQINWEETTVNSWRGIRKYILKESLNSGANVRRYILLWYTNLAFLSIIIVIIFYYMYYISLNIMLT